MTRAFLFALSLSIILSSFVSSLTISTISVSYDTSYDDMARRLDLVACSDGSNGLLTKHYETQGSLPSFPRIGGASVISGWNSPSCGSCWSLTYNDTTINVMAIDRATKGFNIAETALNQLTHGQAKALGRIEAAFTQVESSRCGS
ncbi:Protein SnodProt1 [Erysiphe neolycopersici]|uniref:Protein SnodProt1 n=1 Tax=Erysiphe neolycopersici TaxID=212602 RepID=A0A420I4T5_9PEZI|nr:Protein SnodProt1 [Erysiphe neolycopersici]